MQQAPVVWYNRPNHFLVLSWDFEGGAEELGCKFQGGSGGARVRTTSNSIKFRFSNEYSITINCTVENYTGRFQRASSKGGDVGGTRLEVQEKKDWEVGRGRTSGVPSKLFSAIRFPLTGSYDERSESSVLTQFVQFVQVSLVHRDSSGVEARKRSQQHTQTPENDRLSGNGEPGRPRTLALRPWRELFVEEDARVVDFLFFLLLVLSTELRRHELDLVDLGLPAQLSQFDVQLPLPRTYERRDGDAAASHRAAYSGASGPPSRSSW
ncbi:hypothetical protein B0H14DRAFT_3594074 [Mycena olivaceomarginata]|nr:hypothetical protein B0H14DRAFT_3594074 [Mycena olivaceomarginata]